MKTAIILSLVLASMVFAKDVAKPEYEPYVRDWVTVTPPPKSEKVESEYFFHASNSSDVEWRVYLSDGQVLADNLSSQAPPRLENLPEFETKVGLFTEPSAAHPVENGWLIGYDQGEFGGGLYWFSEGGKNHYKISGHQIEDFVVIKDHIYAIEGLAHMIFSYGSLIRITFDEGVDRWAVSAAIRFPFAPYACFLGEKDILYVVLSDALVAVKDAKKLVTLMQKGEWEGLYPNSVVLSPDGSKLYIGMRQFVGKYDLKSKSFSLLIPDESMLNELSPEVEERIRKTYGD